eukprot:COSAG03_NODE_763_length_5959_cov_1295.360922_7_plen_152_part_00
MAELEVERVLGERTRGGKVSFQLKWKGESESTWEPEANCAGCKGLIEAFRAVTRDREAARATGEQELAAYDAETERLEDVLRATFEQQRRALKDARDRGRSALSLSLSPPPPPFPAPAPPLRLRLHIRLRLCPCPCTHWQCCVQVCAAGTP